MHTPVFIAIPGATSKVVPGLLSKISRTGMELYAGIRMEPGEVMEVEFRTMGRTIHVAGEVRNRSGFCYGLEFCALSIEFLPERGRC